MFNIGSLKVNGQKVVRTVNFGEVPNNTYVILDEDASLSKVGNLLLKSENFFTDLTLGAVFSTNDLFNKKRVKFANVELNFAPVKEE